MAPVQAGKLRGISQAVEKFPDYPIRFPTWKNLTAPG
jgi:hypothetical protein